MQEDAWMQAQGPASEFRLNLAGSWQAHSLRMSSMTSNMAIMTAGMNTTMPCGAVMVVPV
jgi:hypothetical protein